MHTQFQAFSKKFLRKFIPSLVPTENSKMHTLNRKKFLSLHLFGIGKPKRTLFFGKKQKNLPANIGGHTFNTKNIIGLLKYSERIHIG